ncbi:MAG: helix-turn-helix domain-containing protein [Planctomycetes bacterium]|nr:helix-turn-helix domain-containing protein [Planctomycetota bacterium]
MARWFRKRLKEAREAAELTQQALATKLGVSQPYLSGWERGDSRPTGKLLDKTLTWIDRAEEKFELGDYAPEEDEEADEDEDEDVDEDDDKENAFGEWLRTARRRNNLTQGQLAETAGISQVTISLIESGQTPNPRQSTVEKLENALGEEVDTGVAEELEEEGYVEGVGEFRSFNPHDNDDWPDTPGVYVFYDISDRPIYVGKAKKIRSRVKDHSEKFWFKAPIVNSAWYVEIESEELRGQVEKLLIKFLRSNAVLNKQNVERDDD